MLIFKTIQYNTFPYQPTWILIWILLSVLILGYLYSTYPTRLVEVVRSFFSMRFATQLAREEYSLSNPVSVLLSVNFIASAALYIAFLLNQNRISLPYLDGSLWTTFLAALLLTIIYSVKISTIRILNFLFEGKVLAGEYVFILFLVGQVLGILLVPINILLAYGGEEAVPICFFAGNLILALSILLRVGKGCLAALAHRELTPFYLFLYLCTLEILPLFLGYKLIVLLA